MNAKPSFFAELQRRNVYKIGAMYAVAGWLLVQVVTQVLPVFDVSTLVQRIIVVVIVAGFPIALVLSWVYELTPQGIVKTNEVTPSISITSATGHKLNRAIIGTLSVAVLMLVVRLLWPHPSTSTASAETMGVNDKSIAVLPFENLSRDPDNAYFAEGIQDEILTRVAKIGALRVISRTSTQPYAAKPGNLPQIAQQLGVANILEGSVQKIGDQVHINVQLIRASTDGHLWGESYDRKLDNIFGVESDVAQAIADAMNTKLTGAEQAAIDVKPTQNAAAYQAFLRGLAYEVQVSSVDGLSNAVAQYSEAVKLDPGFALAWAHLSIEQGEIYFSVKDHTAERLAQAQKAAEQAINLQPELGEAWLARGYYFYRGLSDYDSALAAFAQARARLPNSAEAIAAISFVERRQGKWEDSIAHLRIASQQDPRNLGYRIQLALTFATLNRFKESNDVVDQALVLAPGNTTLVASKVQAYIGEGDLKAAADLLDAQPSPVADIPLALASLSLYSLRRQYPEIAGAIKAIATMAGTELGENVLNLYGFQGWALRRAGDEAGAQVAFSQGLSVGEKLRATSGSAQLHSSLALIEAGVGKKDAALQDARTAVKMTANDAFTTAQMEINLVQVEAWVGDTHQAIADLTRLLNTPGGETVIDLRLNPVWDPLRRDQQFQKLVAIH